MDVKTFIADFREAFSPVAELPVAFWYSDMPHDVPDKIPGCFFKSISEVRRGEKILSLNAETIGCGGGKLYTGFSDMPEHVPAFVSQKERYKKTPDMVVDFIRELNIRKAPSMYLNLARVDRIDTFDPIEGVVFFATPDVLAGLTTWAFFDNNSPDAVTSTFASGCAAVIAQPMAENLSGGRRTFLGLFDPSVRPYVEPEVLSFAVPMSRFREMLSTMRQSCLFDTHAWNKVLSRIGGGE